MNNLDEILTMVELEHVKKAFLAQNWKGETVFELFFSDTSVHSSPKNPTQTRDILKEKFSPEFLEEIISSQDKNGQNMLHRVADKFPTPFFPQNASTLILSLLSPNAQEKLVLMPDKNGVNPIMKCAERASNRTLFYPDISPFLDIFSKPKKIEVCARSLLKMIHVDPTIIQEYQNGLLPIKFLKILDVMEKGTRPKMKPELIMDLKLQLLMWLVQTFQEPYLKAAYLAQIILCERQEYMSSLSHNENGMDPEEVKNAVDHYMQKINPYFKNRFEQYGPNDLTRIQAIEQEILKEILDNIEENLKSSIALAKSNTDKKEAGDAKYAHEFKTILEKSEAALQFIDKHRQILLERDPKKRNNQILQEARDHFISNTDNAQIAWRAYDPYAKTMGTNPNLFTSPLQGMGNTVLFSIKEAHPNPQTLSSGSMLVRKRAAIYYLVATDKTIEHSVDFKVFINYVAECRRGDNASSKGQDKPICFPGHFSRLSLIGEGHCIARVPKTSLDIINKFLTMHLLPIFKAHVERRTTFSEKKAVYDAIMMMSTHTASDLLQGQIHYTNDWLEIRGAMLEEFNVVEEQHILWHLWQKVFKRPLKAYEKFYVQIILLNLGASFLAASLNEYYVKHIIPLDPEYSQKGDKNNSADVKSNEEHPNEEHPSNDEHPFALMTFETFMQQNAGLPIHILQKQWEGKQKYILKHHSLYNSLLGCIEKLATTNSLDKDDQIEFTKQLVIEIFGGFVIEQSPEEALKSALVAISNLKGISANCLELALSILSEPNSPASVFSNLLQLLNTTLKALTPYLEKESVNIHQRAGDALNSNSTVALTLEHKVNRDNVTAGGQAPLTWDWQATSNAGNSSNTNNSVSPNNITSLQETTPSNAMNQKSETRNAASTPS